MSMNVKITKHPNCPPPLAIDGWIIFAKADTIVIQMYSEIPYVPTEVQLEETQSIVEGSVPIATINHEIGAIISMAKPAVIALAEYILKVLRPEGEATK